MDVCICLTLSGQSYFMGMRGLDTNDIFRPIIWDVEL